MYSSSTRRLASTLVEQSGVISIAQVVAAGCDGELPAREVAAARWTKLAGGIYLASAEEPTLLQRAWCAQLVGGAASVVSGSLACRLRGVADTS